MANICTNTLFAVTRDKVIRDSLNELIRDRFDCSDILSADNEVFECKIEFKSRWRFPKEEMEKLMQNFPNDNDFYIHVVSYEFGCEYVGFNIYSLGEWRDKFVD